MSRMHPACWDAHKPRRPWSLDSGGPCRNDGVLGLAETTSNQVRFYVAPMRETFFCLSRNTEFTGPPLGDIQ